MSALTVRIDKYLDSEGLRAPRVPARIYPIDKTGKSTDSKLIHRELIPISQNPTDVARVELPPGTYYVETVLPSGETLADSVTVAANETSELVLRAPDSPNEWFSWQDLVGNARPALKMKALAKQPVVGRSIKLLSTPPPPLVAGEPHGADVWKWLADSESTSAEAFVKFLNQGKEAVDVPPYDRTDARAVYRLTLDDTGRQRTHGLRALVPHAPRYFATVPRKRSVELISLPIPWHVIGSGREASIELAVQQVRVADSFSVTATARDEDLGPLLGFMSSGSLSVAREIAETAKDSLFYKVANPYAAAAGGYAMVATAQHATDRDWHHWIRNLMSGFAHIPDGAIQWAHLRLRMRRSPSDFDEARQALKLAYRRGIPFYSMGVKWLMEGFEWVAGGDPQVEEMARNVRRVAWLTNLQQPFTILRIGGTKDV